MQKKKGYPWSLFSKKFTDYWVLPYLRRMSTILFGSRTLETTQTRLSIEPEEARNFQKLQETERYQDKYRARLTFEQIEKKKLLRYHSKNARENTEIKSYIKENKLFIDGIAYTAETLREEEEES
ncbi:hypothetical protein JTB14_009909 [Gonioctena quinquepunctata]|nr:hypothetical protein JTB14_009909 [Gonioctena quinquepunctata]